MLFFIYILIFFSFCGFPRKAVAEDIIPVAEKQTTLKVNSINFDNSDSIIFLGTSGVENNSEIKITKQALTEPDRIFFDIENAVITFPNSTYEIKNSRLKQVRIAQNSIEPNIVRIVIWNSPNYDASHIKVLKINNNIVIKLSNEIPIQQYLTQTYKETKESAIEYYEKAVAIQEETEVKPQESDEIFNKVQQAFKEDNQELVRPNIEQRQARLKSRFFLENAEARNGNLLIGGIGVVNVEKPFVLTEPNRVVFDLPNTIVLQELRDKEFKLSDTETVKIGQFEPSKARIVIKTDKPESYRPIYSTNLQTLLIAKSALISGVNLSKTTSELAYFKEENINSTTDVINIIFSNPIIYSIKREETKLYLYIYNLANFNADSFNATSSKSKSGFIAKQIGTNAYRFNFPVNSGTLVDCYETLNASQLRFVFTTQKVIQTVTDPKLTPVTPTVPTEKKPTQTKTPVRKPEVKSETKPQQQKKENPFSALMERQPEKKVEPKKPSKTEETKISKIKKKMIVIDAGHGGNDTGALRGSTLEKNLTLKIALKVRDCLREKGLKNIVLTRYNDKTLSLDERVQIANKYNADIFVSIHINASVKSEINGIETHYYTDKGYNVAKIIHKELMNNVDAMDRGLFKSKFYVINHTEAPAVLLELGFISNEQERSSLNSAKRQMNSAQAIADGIVNYLVEYRKK
ncbi:MAG: N-acetylmuramoyl-L-alanine amidase [Candidatus Gastranaerophilales bacterium]|nr:N-acetylmuramoyl-L-alanine amidase [Candidatus Gastranaerophilales bacterium]